MNTPVPHDLIVDLCEKLGYDPATVHRIEITPGSVKVTHNHLVQTADGAVVASDATAGQILDRLDGIHKAITDGTRRAAKDAGRAAADALTTAASKGARR